MSPMSRIWSSSCSKPKVRAGAISAGVALGRDFHSSDWLADGVREIDIAGETEGVGGKDGDALIAFFHGDRRV